MKNENTYALLINPRSIRFESGLGGSSGYGRFELNIVRIVEDGKIRNPSTGDSFDDLEFSCQWDQGKQEDRTYAWSVTYRDVYRVDYANAERMLKMLKRVRKIEEKLVVRPTTFGQFVTLIAQKLGINQVKKESRRSAASMSYDDNDYSSFAIKEAQSLIDSLIEDARKPAEVEAR